IHRDWQRERGLRSPEVAILARIYAHGEAVRPLSEFRNTTREMDDMFETLADQLTEAGQLAASPSFVRRAGRWTALIVTAGWLQLAWSFGASRSSYAAAVVTGAILLIGTGWFSRRGLSAAGQRTRQHLLGLRKFLSRADGQTIDRVPPETFHTLLPWAIALRVTDAWIKRFDGHTVAPNGWYTAPTPVGVADIAAEIER